MEKHLKMLLRKSLGIVLIIGGVLGLFLPFLQGIIMILIGLALLGNERLMQKLRLWSVCVRTYFIIKKNN